MFENNAAVIGLSEALSRCRCCLERSPEKLLNKPYLSGGETEIYLDMLRQCFDIHLSASEDSCGICEECVSCLRNASQFKLRVQHCQELLRDKLQLALQALGDVKLETTEDVHSEHVSEYDSQANEEKSDLEEPSEDAILRDKPAVLLEMFDDAGTNIEAMLRENKLNFDEDAAMKLEMLFEEEVGASNKANNNCRRIGSGATQQLAMTCSVRLERLQQCRICHSALAQESLPTHMKDMHSDSFAVRAEEEACTCDICGEQFTNNIDLVDHIQKHIDPPYSCKTCLIEFSSKVLFDEHLHNHRAPTDSSDALSTNLNEQGVIEAETKSYCCDKCNKSFKRKNHLSIHMKVHSRQRPDKCETCNKRFRSHKDLIKHIRVHTGEKPYKCEICNKHFSTTSSLNFHTRNHTGHKPYKCDICNAQFSQKSHLCSHSLIHTGQKQHKCKTCGKRFAHTSSLNLHTKIHRPKQYKCEICYKYFTHKTTLDVHTRVHTGQKPYKCEICNNLFSQNSHLKKHLRIHTGLKPYECEICNKRFTRKEGLHSHSMVHSGQKPYQCEICDRKFAIKTSMTSHIRLCHSIQKTYQCYMCDKKFGRRDYLIGHIRVHTGEKPYQCKICNERFNHTSSLKSHMRKHTGEKLSSSGRRS